MVFLCFRPYNCLHLTTLGNRHIHVRNVLAPIPRLGSLHLLDDIDAVDDLAKDGVLVVQEGGRDGGDEELGAVGVGPAVGHGEEARLVVLEGEVLVVKGLVAPDGGGACAVAVEEVAALADEVCDLLCVSEFCLENKEWEREGKGKGTDDAVKLGALVALWSA